MFDDAVNPERPGDGRLLGDCVRCVLWILAEIVMAAFVKGKSGNPAGRPKGVGVSGRSLMLKTLDGVLSRPAAERLMRETMEAELIKDPIAFFREFVMPLLPKESLVKTENIDKAPLRIVPTSDGVNVTTGDEAAAPEPVRGVDDNGNGHDGSGILDIRDRANPANGNGRHN